jgi:hypothetical protein
MALSFVIKLFLLCFFCREPSIPEGRSGKAKNPNFVVNVDLKKSENIIWLSAILPVGLDGRNNESVEQPFAEVSSVQLVAELVKVVL